MQAGSTAAAVPAVAGNSRSQAHNKGVAVRPGWWPVVPQLWFVALLVAAGSQWPRPRQPMFPGALQQLSAGSPGCRPVPAMRDVWQ